MAMLRLLLVLLLAFAAAPVAARSPTVAERLDRAERMQDWPAVEKLSAGFAFSRRGDVYAVTTIIDGCVARGCDAEAAIKRLRGPLVDDGVREFARAWLEYASGDPAAARPRFEALARDPRSAWLGIFGRLSYAADARNVSLLRDALRDARSDAAVEKALAEDIATAEMSLASLQSDDARLARLAQAAADSAGAMMVAFAQQLARDEFADARETLRRYVERHGDDQDAVLSRLELARATQDPAAVVEEGRRALQSHPGYWRVRFSLAQSLIEMEDEAAAREVLSKGFPVAFAAARLEVAIAGSAFVRFGAEEARAFAKALEPWRDRPEALSAIASVMLEAGEREQAAAMLDRADAMSEGLPATLNVRARLAREAGDQKQYLALLERAAAWTPKEVMPQLLLGLAYARAGESMKAARIAAALRRSPRYVRPGALDILEKAAREADPSFRTASASP